MVGSLLDQMTVWKTVCIVDVWIRPHLIFTDIGQCTVWGCTIGHIQSVDPETRCIVLVLLLTMFHSLGFMTNSLGLDSTVLILCWIR